MFRAARHPKHLARLQFDLKELHAESPAHDVKQPVFMFMLVPHERALKLDEFHVLAVQRGDDLLAPTP